MDAAAGYWIHRAVFSGTLHAAGGNRFSAMFLRWMVPVRFHFGCLAAR